MKALSQVAGILLLASVAAGISYWFRGAPVRAVVCDPAAMKPDELCLETVLADFSGNLLWIDARSRRDWETDGVSGSLLWNLDPGEDSQAFEAEAMARLIDGPKVIVYCGDENCGVSRQVAERIRALGLGSDVYVLHGGWSALKAAGKVTASSPRP